MENMTLSLRLADGTGVVWNFIDENACRRYRTVIRITECDGTPEPHTGTAVIINVVSGTEFPEPAGTAIRRRPEMAAQLVGDRQIEIILTPGFSMPYSDKVQLTKRIIWYGLLPACLEGRTYLIHGALLEHHGRGIILTGASGSGKSTCCKRVPPPWKGWADDALLLCRTPNGYLAQPLPTWSQFYSHYRGPIVKTNWHHAIPVYGIFSLEHADRDRIIPRTLTEKYLTLLRSHTDFREDWQIDRSSAIDRQLAEAAVDFTRQAIHELPVYTLQCARHGKFWEELEKTFTVEARERRSALSCPPLSDRQSF